MSYRKPPVLDADEEKEFRIYSDQYYTECIRQAGDIIKSAYHSEFLTASERSSMLVALFEKLASPRVYLVEKWLKERAKKEAGITD